MEKILFVTTIDATIKAFLLPYMKWFQEQGYEVHAACARGEEEPLSHCSRQFDLSFSRSPMDTSNRKGYQQLKEIIEQEGYALIHCHTPVAGVCCRLAAKKARKRGAKVVYTAHGFHFFTGASKKNWLLFYPVEKWLSAHTDCLITINDEDYRRALEKGFRAGRIEKVSGVGVDLTSFQPVNESERLRLRREKGVPEQDFILFYAAELSARKNQMELLAVAEALEDKISDFNILLAGKGPMREELETAVQQRGLAGRFQFLGFRTDVKELVQLSDLLISTSRQEGLPVNIMEGMACGKAVVASDVRGNRDLVQDSVNGYTFALGDVKKAVDSITKLYCDSDKRQACEARSLEMAAEYALEKALREHSAIYQALLCRF